MVNSVKVNCDAKHGCNLVRSRFFPPHPHFSTPITGDVGRPLGLKVDMESSTASVAESHSQSDVQKGCHDLLYVYIYIYVYTSVL